MLQQLIDLKRAHTPLRDRDACSVSLTVHLALFSYEHDKVLLVHDLGGRESGGLQFRGPKPERWVLPTGRTNWNETPYEAVQRELREEGNLREETSFKISRLPLKTSTNKRRIKKGESPHIEVFFVGELTNPFETETIPTTGKIKVVDPAGHITEACWLPIVELPSGEEAAEYCRIFDETKKSGAPIEETENPWVIAEGKRIFPISPKHLNFILSYIFGEMSVDELDGKIPALLEEAKRTGFALPRIA